MRVLVAEDNLLMRDGLARLLRDHGHEVSQVEDGPGLQRALLDDPPDVAIVDIRLPPGYTDEGLRAAVRARRARPGLPVLMLSQYVEHLYARELLADGAGGVGYLLKDRVTDLDDFLDAVARVARGGTALDPEVVGRMLSRTRRRGLVTDLTPREGEILDLMAQGRSNGAIGARLQIGDSAVTKHIAAVFAKLGLAPCPDDNRRVLAVLAKLRQDQG